jgi:dienelactone hydrolase
VEVSEQTIQAGAVSLPADIELPERAGGVVLFAHGSGSSRHSPRNRAVAGQLQSAGLGTVLVDLLTAEEEREDERTAALRFDIELLADRLAGIVGWLSDDPSTYRLPIGLFGASTGAGAALVAAVREPTRVMAVVSRGGRPDLAGAALHDVRAPTLLLVGGRDSTVLQLNEQAAQAMASADTRVHVVPEATHLFEEPGALEEVAQEAGAWFTAHLHRQE